HIYLRCEIATRTRVVSLIQFFPPLSTHTHTNTHTHTHTHTYTHTLPFPLISVCLEPCVYTFVITQALFCANGPSEMISNNGSFPGGDRDGERGREREVGVGGGGGRER